MATNVSLTADLERFARECVENGRYNNVSEVVRSALRLLQDAEHGRRAFGVMLDEVRDEAKRQGVHNVDLVAAEMDSIIAAKG
jgi:antitoxin ParD1/3/4